MKPILNTISRLHLVESVHGTWAYHLSVTGDNGQPTLCGNTRVMRTLIPFSSWNSEPGHIPMKYCSKCSELAKQAGFKIPEPTDKTLVFDLTK